MIEITLIKLEHKLYSLKLVDWCICRNRYIAFVKNAAFQFQQLRIKKMKEEQEAEQVATNYLSVLIT